MNLAGTHLRCTTDTLQMKYRMLFILLISALTVGPAAAEPDPDEPRRGTFALVNARIVTVTNGTIERGTLVVQDDRIIAVGSDVDVPATAERIDCEGLTLYPGLIDAGTRLGLAEIGSVDETNDYNEVGDVVPHMHALTAVNPNSVHIPVTRVSGVTTVLTAPGGGLLPGTAALINLHGYTPDQMHLGGVDAIVLNFPSRAKRGPWDDREEEKREKEYENALDKLNEIFDRADLYARIDSTYRTDPDVDRRPEYAPAADALLPVIRGESYLLINANRAQEITDALDWLDERGLSEQAILSGALEGWRVADEIADAEVPVLVGPVLDNPARASDRYDKAYANAGLLHDAGVKVAIRTGEAENVRNLPFHAGFAAAYGLGQEDALRAVTINAAEIFGVDELIGSLETGKLANLFAADGDPFQPSTQVHHLFINGYKIPLDNRQLRLYEEFLDREPGVSLHPAR